jgi:hypothetical protein
MSNGVTHFKHGIFTEGALELGLQDSYTIK